MDTGCVQVVVAVDKQQNADRIATALVDERLAACVQIVGPMHGDALVLRAARAYESTREWKLPVVPGRSP